MSRVLALLSEGQEPAVRRAMSRRTAALIASVRYMKENKHEQFAFIERLGWGLARFEIIAALNSFYLLVLGPLASSARGRADTLWRDIPIMYGEEFLFDNQRAKQIRTAAQSFSNIARKIPGGLEAITGTQASDIVFKIYRELIDATDN